MCKLNGENILQIKHASLALRGLTYRETVKFFHQKGRLLSAFVRPSLWLFVFAAGVGSVTGVDPGLNHPYPIQNVNYFEYIIPGLIGMVLLFSGMQSSLSMVYDREMGVMRLLLTAPLPRWYLLTAKLLSGTFLSVLQAYVFLIICVPIINLMVNFSTPIIGWLYILPATILFGMMLGALGLLISVYIKQLENFAGTMNFVIFPMFFISSALYPLWRLKDNGAEFVWWIANINPFTYGVELVRWASLGQVYIPGLIVTLICTILFLSFATIGYDPQKGMRKNGGGKPS
jgi:ABC-2 type transport system permease protein|tara:strand:+ start:21 stop:884 length:864 start_codon:yes stop_codon:yes gene_type:complete